MYNFKKLALVTAMSGAFVAPVTLADDADTDIDVTAGVAIANELVGGAVTIDLAASATTVDLGLTDDAGVTQTVSEGAIFDVTFTLSGGTFGDDVSVIDLDYSGTVGEVSISLEEGGQDGGTSVRFRVTIVAVGGIGDETLSLQMKTVDVESAATDVTVAASVTVINSSGLDDVDEGAVAVSGTNILVDFASGVDAVVTAGASAALIEVSDRDELSDSTEADDVLESDITGLPVGVEAVRVATVTLNEDDTLTDLDGAAFGIDALEAGLGDFAFTVTSAGSGIEDTDTVWIDLDDDGALDGGESFVIAGGSATITIPSETFLANEAVSTDVYFSRTSLADLRPTTYTLAVSYTLDDADSIESEDTSGSGTTVFNGLAIRDVFSNFPLAGTDIGNLRVTSTDATAGGFNSIFLQIWERDGTDRGFLEYGTLDDAETVNISAADVLGMLGLTEWDGDGNKVFLEIWASDHAVVLPLINRNGVLTNMSQSTLPSQTAAGGAGSPDLADF